MHGQQNIKLSSLILYSYVFLAPPPQTLQDVPSPIWIRFSSESVYVNIMVWIN